MATPNDMPTDALRLARLNLRTRFHRPAARTSTMNVDAIETYQNTLDQIAQTLRKGKADQ